MTDNHDFISGMPDRFSAKTRGSVRYRRKRYVRCDKTKQRMGYGWSIRAQEVKREVITGEFCRRRAEMFEHLLREMEIVSIVENHLPKSQDAVGWGNGYSEKLQWGTAGSPPRITKKTKDLHCWDTKGPPEQLPSAHWALMTKRNPWGFCVQRSLLFSFQA